MAPRASVKISLIGLQIPTCYHRFGVLHSFSSPDNRMRNFSYKALGRVIVGRTEEE